MNQPGNREITTGELPDLTRAELPSALPLEGWNTVTLHCQVDAIGPSELHPDLVKLELSFPPEKAPEPCPRCHGRKVVPPAWHCEEDGPAPCPECSACTATALHAVLGRVRCALPAGHYDEERRPAPGSGEPFSRDPGGWHQSARDREGLQLCWADTADAATPHGAPAAPDARRGWAVSLACPTCGGSTGGELHPRIKGVVRCANCKEHLPLIPTEGGAAAWRES
ncbi:hypothetical protein B9W64_37935 [Streptomyces sp. CS159]|uniref:hypothetical protein n=1 Tax=Streptomyces sp. CS159 TaxID=1982762 RepID=UPI000B423248|nr:hypothetical protein [Streptomyces sp. CS159]OVZ99577.1 hypothetical protein B9W64_37935 [Streptomyces sp. CS159]